MNTALKLTLVGFCVFSMSSCSMMDRGDDSNYPTYSYNPGQSDSLNNYKTLNYEYNYKQKQDVVVPDSYHVGEFHSPVSFKERDQNWVGSQNPQGYTIELTEGDKASQVAQVLYKTPKNERMAQIKYERDGKTHYKGVYGTYPSAEEAQKALNGLPREIKSGASVINWSNVQH